MKQVGTMTLFVDPSGNDKDAWQNSGYKLSASLANEPDLISQASRKGRTSTRRS